VLQHQYYSTTVRHCGSPFRSLWQCYSAVPFLRHGTGSGCLALYRATAAITHEIESSEKGSTLTRERAQPQQKQRHACLEDRDTGEITELPTVHSSLPVTVTSLRRASLWQRCMCLLLLLFRFPHCLSLSLHTAALKRRPVSAGTPPTTPHVRSRILRCFCSFPSLPFAHRPLLCLLAFLLDLVLGAGGQKAAAGITNALVKCFQYLISL
jgi:hypothetical protein